MNHLEVFLSLVSLSSQSVLFGFVLARKAYRVLPLFASFVSVTLFSSLCVFFTFLYAGFESSPSYYGFWLSLFLFVTTRSLAIGELCRYELRDYRGIWALAWRLLAALSALFVAHALIDAWGQPNGIAIYWTCFARDFAFASIFILAVLLLFRKYYGIGLDHLSRLIAIGIFLTCFVDAIGNTIVLNRLEGALLPWFLESQRAVWPSMEPLVRRLDDIWSTVHLGAFVISVGIWCHALRQPLRAQNESKELLPRGAYERISGAISIRLATFNDRLAELLEP